MSRYRFTIISNANPTQAKFTLKETVNGVSRAVAIDSGDTITAIIYKDGAALSTPTTINTAAAGSDLANGKIIAEWTQVESVTWDTGDAELWVTRNNVPWIPAKIKIVRGPG